MNYRIVEYKNSYRPFIYHIQVQKSFLGIKYWRTFEWSNGWDRAHDYIKEHKRMVNEGEERIVHLMQ